MKYLLFVAVCGFFMGASSTMVSMVMDKPESRFFRFGVNAMVGSWILGGALLLIAAARELL